MQESKVGQRSEFLPKESALAADQDIRWRQYMDRIAACDQSGLSALFHETGAVVYGLAMRMLNSPADAEEVTSDVYAQIWRSATAYREARGPVLSWLAVMTRSRAIDRLRTRGFQARSDHSLAVVEKLHVYGSEAASVSRLDGQRVLVAFHSLPADQRMVVNLAYFSGMTHSEIAGQLGIPIGTVKTRIRLGMSKLRECILGTS